MTTVDDLTYAMYQRASNLLGTEDNPAWVAEVVDEAMYALIETGNPWPFKVLGERAMRRLYTKLYPGSGWHDYPEWDGTLRP